MHYSPDLKEDWGRVLQEATNATLMHERDFLAYHSSGKFQDCSVILYNKNKPVAVFAAHREGEFVHSHKGLSYAGFIHVPGTFDQKLEQFKTLMQYFESLGVSHLQIKETPTFYNSLQEEAMAYILHLTKAKTTQMELSLTIELPLEVKNKGKKANIKQAGRQNLKITESNEVKSFWDTLLVPNLQNRYQTRPTHSYEEMTFLVEKFPDKIRQFNVFQDERMVAGATVYFSKNCIHTQYLASNSTGRELHALDALVNHLANTFTGKYSFLDFGHSNENQGLMINKGLFKWKENFGAKPYIHRHYKVPVESWRNLDRVYKEV
ncbi:hypothetical protein [Cyclobacterium marinum]|uniref:BioF2-like acetyltransferase domain-containing protein n=1 Tax=Cyclobacterium marinum (strain ATCC 25205 / DSM 745 / LMG 13164 / NCIMB 1802) TaxID=880070 RepID=G0J2S6_CYCMS|nr:hypothetical protein [Cyclobacterium marinum]AEL27413.1 hypothetical protein Cycma_3701 [Cyclobacterium marinum DSM 745]